MTDVLQIAGHGLEARFLGLGAILRDLRLAGHPPPLVLGLEDVAHYPVHSAYMGATAGRFANRIGGARFELDGMAYQLDRNFLGRHMLHGGSDGMGRLPWQVVDHRADSIRFAITLPDGHMGFPGKLDATATFSCTPDSTLRIDYEATTDAPTLCNLAHHSYWCLDDIGDLSRHVLTVHADRYVPVDSDLIPTGVASVDGTSFDFRTGRALPGKGLLDHNLCLSDTRQALREVAILHSDASGVTMWVATTEPGLQVYDGAKLSPEVAGLGGRRYGAHAGIALEAQLWPDAPNQPGFPSAVLRPGDTYRQTTTFSFSKG